MKRFILLMASLLFAVGMPFVGTAADVNVNSNVPPPPAPEAPPPLEFSEPPDVVVVPSRTGDVYLVPNTVGVYFYGGYWYRFYGNNSFRASLYSGPWVTIGMPLVPTAVVVIPPDYILALPPGYHRIPYSGFYSNWRDWGLRRHWQSYDWYKDHSAHRWGGKELLKPPPGHPGDRRPRDRGPRVKGNGWPQDKGAGVKGDGKEPPDKGAGVKGGGRGPYDKGAGVKGGGGPYDKGAGVKGGGRGPYDKGPGVKSGDRGPGGWSPGGPGPGGGGFEGMKPGGAEPKTGPPGKPE